jgi:hypothetical protein
MVKHFQSRIEEDTSYQVHSADVVQLRRSVRFHQPVPAHFRKNCPLPKELPRAQSGDGLSLIKGGYIEVRVPGVESHRGQLPCLRVLELALPFDDKVEPVFFLRVDDCTIDRRILKAGLIDLGTRGSTIRLAIWALLTNNSGRRSLLHLLALTQDKNLIEWTLSAQVFDLECNQYNCVL